MATVSTIGPKTVVRGNVHGEGDLSIEGRVEGDVNVEGNVSVAPMAQVKGSVAGANVTILGTVEGDVSCADTLSVEPNAKVLGDMTGPRVQIAEGSIVRGMVRTEGDPPRPAPGRIVRHAAAEPAKKKQLAAVSAPALPAPALDVGIGDEPPRDKPHKKHKDKEKKKKRPPDPIVPVLAKRTKGKRKGEKRAR